MLFFRWFLHRRKPTPPPQAWASKAPAPADTPQRAYLPDVPYLLPKDAQEDERLRRWRTIRGMVRSLQQQESQQQKATPRTRIWSALKGLSLILIAVVVETGVSNLHQEWWNFFAEPFVGGCACFGIALLVHALRRKIEREKTRA